jgi:photosystem II stability/assembly factor-like uncharacterized protein
MDPLHPYTIYVGGSTSGIGAGVYKSDDNGTNWAAFTTGVPETPFCLAADPVDPFTVYAGLAGNGVYKTTDGGLHWTAANGGIANLTVYGLAVDPVNPINVFANASDGLYKSTNGGASWSKVSSLINGGAVAIDPTMPTTVYAGGFDLFKSTDGGITWNGTNVGASAYGPIVLDPYNSSILYIGTASGRFGGISKSVDGAATWMPASNGLTDTGVVSIAVDPSNTSVIYAGTYSGVFTSGDGATTWQPTGR